MIKANIKGNEKVEIEICGRLREITAESILFIHSVWEKINQENKDAGDMFKRLFCSAVEEIMFEDEEGIAKAVEKAAKNVEDMSDKSLDELKKELIDLIKEL